MYVLQLESPLSRIACKTMFPRSSKTSPMQVRLSPSSLSGLDLNEIAKGIVLWMLTGDKVETAINIARSCNLILKDSVCNPNPVVANVLPTKSTICYYTYIHTHIQNIRAYISIRNVNASYSQMVSKITHVKSKDEFSSKLRSGFDDMQTHRSQDGSTVVLVLDGSTIHTLLYKHTYVNLCLYFVYECNS